MWTCASGPSTLKMAETWVINLMKTLWGYDPAEMKNMFYWLLHTRLIHMYWLNSLANNNLQESANKIKNRVSHTFFIHVQYIGHDTLSHNKHKMFSHCGYTSPYVCLLKPPFISCIYYMYDGINLIALNSSSLSSPCFVKVLIHCGHDVFYSHSL